MTTREIATLTGKENSHVYRDAIKMLEQLGYTNQQVDGCHQEWIHPQNKQKYYELALNRDETLCLVSGYSAPLRMKIIKRLDELESPQQRIPQTFSEALKLAAIQAEQLEAAKPAIEFVERYVESTGNKGFREVCKLINANESEFRDFLLNEKIMYRLGGAWTAYQNHIDAGRFSVKTGVAQHSEHAYTAAKFTPKGLAWIAMLWNKNESNNRPLME